MDDINIAGKPTAVLAIEHAAGLEFGCKKCGKVHFAGTWVVGLTVGEQRFLVGKNPPVRCCDEEKQFLEVFDTEAEADVLRDAVARQLAENQTTEGLMLYGFAVINALGSKAIN